MNIICIPPNREISHSMKTISKCTCINCGVNPYLMPRHGKSRQHTDNTSTLSLHPPTLPPIPPPSLESQRIFPVDPRHFILRIPRDTETPTNLRIPPHLSTPKPRALQTLTTTPKCPTYPPPRPTWNSQRSYYKRTQTQ